MNMAGDELLFPNSFDEVIFVFRLSSDAFPDPFEVDARYGEGLIADRVREQYLEDHMKSADLNPAKETA